MPDRRPMSSALSKATGIGPDRRGSLTLGELQSSDNPLSTLFGKIKESAGDDPLQTALAILPILPFFRALGKPVAEMEGATFKPPSGSGLPKSLRMTNYDARTGDLDFHAANPTAQRFQAKPAQIDTLIEKGGLELEQPPARDVASMQRRIAEELDAASTDPRNRLAPFESATREVIPKETKSPIRETLDTFEKGAARRTLVPPRKK